jgi:hypothetical protein
VSGARRLALFLLAASLLSACGDDGGPKAPPGVSQSAFERQLADAQQVSASDFPSADGRTLEELANTVTAGPQVGLATSVFVPGENRLAFGVIDAENRFVYGKTAVYIARTPDSSAQGPYPAPADSLVTEGRYRSKQAALESSPIAAIYAATVPFKRAGSYSLLVLTRSDGQLLGATAEVGVRRESPIPAVAAPELHKDSFKDVVGKRPVALLFATPQLCQSRVCGPVVDIELQMRAKYGDRMTFIHQEVYVDNQVDKGLRKPLLDFNLQTEPWLFTVDKTGRISARLEGSFGVAAFEQAVEAALS